MAAADLLLQEFDKEVRKIRMFDVRGWLGVAAAR
jgi:hypothetical protein